MINTEDQEQLFKLIAEYLEKDISCFAIGGTAMMFYGYKTTTKDIDLVFENEESCKIFIKAIEELGYKEQSTKGIYSENQNPKPKMFTRGDERFDLFIKNVFKFELKKTFKELIKERRDFIGKKEFILYILPPEYLVLLKAITRREKDIEDIKTIIEYNKNIQWDIIIKEAISQKENNEWILIDLEEAMKELKKITFIPSKYFKMIYESEKKIKY